MKIGGVHVLLLLCMGPRCVSAATGLLRGVGSPNAAAVEETRNLQTVGSITALDLINAKTDLKITTLTTGQVIAVSSIPGMTSPDFNIDAKSTGNVLSVVFTLNSVQVRIENSAPWAFCGNSGPDFSTCPSLINGTHAITATPYSGRNGTGTIGIPASVTFTIVSSLPASPTKSPIAPTKSPLVAPTGSPVALVTPTKSPVAAPTKSPVVEPTKSPVAAPTKNPTTAPTKSPVAAPTKSPVVAPTKSPVVAPTKSPVAAPTKSPTSAPTKSPVAPPTKNPVAPPTKSPVAPPTKNPVLPPQPTVSPLLINCGGSAYTDSLNRVWLADQFFGSGTTVWGTGSPIANTVDDILYQTERFGTSMTYSIPRPAGLYTVTLHFAEIL
jgi:Malectin domain